jgi:hypothetical protein
MTNQPAISDDPEPAVQTRFGADLTAQVWANMNAGPDGDAANDDIVQAHANHTRRGQPGPLWPGSAA